MAYQKGPKQWVKLAVKSNQSRMFILPDVGIPKNNGRTLRGPGHGDFLPMGPWVTSHKPSQLGELYLFGAENRSTEAGLNGNKWGRNHGKMMRIQPKHDFFLQFPQFWAILHGCWQVRYVCGPVLPSFEAGYS